MTIRFQVGGPLFHPVAQQANEVAKLLGPGFDCQIVEGAPAFDNLDDVDLLVPMGLFWTGMSAEWAGSLNYEPLSEIRKQAIRDYVGSGRPLLCYHGGIASYDDWPEYGRLLGYKWLWGVTLHTPVTVQTFRPLISHPIVEGVDSFEVEDETYFNVQMAPDVAVKVIAHIEYEKAKMPILFEIEGGRIPGAGKSVYVGNGHDMRAFEHGNVQKLIVNSIKYLLNR
ncbi:ThuA domain-containing protein [Devosia algicola]|uniref:ThuA domain-containing protein n=1 Tax=Devosia algicola TaxID=3026418 RepID=A0ABY7YLB6_9HYPH|nr:ThuA domain-containing protein [Devosia algicola]WDR01982.1 ThuA domain-containing protein [Devosia algicola]